MTSTQTHSNTPATDDCRTWLEVTFGAGFVIHHTLECDIASVGDECVGDCAVVRQA